MSTRSYALANARITSALTTLHRREYEILNPPRIHTTRVGFAAESLRTYTVCASLKHSGCVNAVSWSDDGRFLLTGSDDRSVKIWDTASSLEQFAKEPLQEVHTDHLHNIFCVSYKPGSVDEVLSCAADGNLMQHSLVRNTSRIVDSCNDIMHMFTFQNDNPHIVYTALGEGLVSRIDLRQPANLVYNPELHPDKYIITSPPKVKTIIQFPPNVSTHYLIVGGLGGTVSQYDLRQLGHVCCTYRPDGLVGQSNTELSVSGIDMSKCGRKLAVSYQADQIYIFNTYGGGEVVKPKLCVGGHINYKTFLKAVRFYGPNDDYILSGSDSGHIWVWSSSTGQCHAVLLGDEHTLNGIIPHPLQSVFVSYGIDSDAKIWRPFEEAKPGLGSGLDLTHTHTIDTPLFYSQASTFDHTDTLCDYVESVLSQVHTTNVVTDVPNFVRACKNLRERFMHDKREAYAARNKKARQSCSSCANPTYNPSAYPHYPSDCDNPLTVSLCMGICMESKALGNEYFKHKFVELAGLEYSKAAYYGIVSLYILRMKDIDSEYATHVETLSTSRFRHTATHAYMGQTDASMRTYTRTDKYVQNDGGLAHHVSGTDTLAWDYRTGMSLSKLVKFIWSNGKYLTLDDPDKPVEQRSLLMLLSQVFNNLAACALQLKRPTYAVHLCDVTLRISPTETKAIFRKGCALLELNEYDEALTCLNQAHTLNAQDTAIKAKIAQAKRARSSYVNKQKLAYASMFES